MYLVTLHDWKVIHSQCVPLTVKCFKVSPHLLSDHGQRVSVLRQEVEDAPYLEGVVVGDEQLTPVQVLPGAQRPAHFVEVLTVKVTRHLRRSRTTTTLVRLFVFLGSSSLCNETSDKHNSDKSVFMSEACWSEAFLAFNMKNMFYISLHWAEEWVLESPFISHIWIVFK